ncbi:MAG: response regulator transcription factor [Saprospiraceae bacterium]|nr:response regulator transcription factor [Saprospiraceae bacterium]
MADILIIEDELLISEDIREICNLANHKVLDVAYTSGQALLLLKQIRPELILLDINLGGEIDGIELAQYIDQNYGIPYIFITSFSDASTLDKIKKCNSVGYIVKPFSQEQLLSSITLGLNATSKHSSFSQKLTIKGISLSDRETEILRLLVMGQTREQVTQNVFLSINTVKYHIKNIYKKIGVSTQVELITWWNM